MGRLVQAEDSVGGTILNTYDTLDRLVSQATGLGTVNYQYDALGRRTRLDAPGQASVFYGYDAASRLRTITQAPLNPVDILGSGPGSPAPGGPRMAVMSPMHSASPEPCDSGNCTPEAT